MDSNNTPRPYLMYRACTFSVRPLEVVRETDKSVFLPDGKHRLKVVQGDEIFATFQEAKDENVRRWKSTVERAEKQLSYAREMLKQAEELTHARPRPFILEGACDAGSLYGIERSE